MTAVATWLVVNWQYLVAVLFSFMGAMGFLIFLRGFLLGFGQIVYINVHAEHFEHAQARTMWGFLVMLNAFVWWVAFKGVLALFGLATVNGTLTLSILIPYGLIAGYLWLTSKKSGHH
ncbi:MAG: hypothetical protein QG621_561 [Patescibacteria group bacterium]|jgi:hypothetical protein|nr:hypothetical protein [Patescibacteria group bacterium]